MRYRVTHYLVDFVRIDKLVSTTLKMWPDTFLDSSPSGVRSNLPCHFNQCFDIFIELALLNCKTVSTRKPSFIVSEAKAMLQAQNLHGHRKLQGWI